MKTLREFRTMPDDQAYLCDNGHIAAKHGLTIPFNCGSRQWMGQGLVKIEFYSGDKRFGTQYQVSDYTNITTLSPIPAAMWTFDPAIAL